MKSIYINKKYTIDFSKKFHLMLYGNIDLEKYIIVILHFDNIHILIKLF